MAMSKKRHKKITAPPPPRSRRITLYKQEASSRFFSMAILIGLCAVGIGVINEQQYLTSLIPFSLAGFIILANFTEVRKLDIFEDTMIVQYLDATQTYKAEDIEMIEWSTRVVIDRYFFHRGYYELTPVLLIQTGNGKKIRIPPVAEFDIEKSLLEWRNKYKTLSTEEVVASE
jgi:hypothetical protein